MKIFRFCFFAVNLLIISVCANAVEPPKIFTDGCIAYEKEGFEKAFSIWTKGSPLENDKTSLMNIKGGMVQVETLYGKMIGHEIIEVYQITKNIVRVYGVLLYEKGPVYVYADCYTSGVNWVIPEFSFHTKAQMILPEKLIFKK